MVASRNSQKSLASLAVEELQTEEVPVAAKKRRGPRAGTEAAKHGGQSVSNRYGTDFFAQIGAKGGRIVKEHYGSEFYTNIGSKGGKTTRDTQGKEFYSRIGRLGGQKGKGRPKLRASDKELFGRDKS